MDSILITIKKMLGLDAVYDVFDPEIIVYINTAINVLEQLGVGVDGYIVTSADNTWEEFLTDISKLEGVKTYIYIRVRMLFDPPANSTLSKTLEDTARELEWRLNVKAEHLQDVEAL
jgi:hypothetical protein